MISVSYGIRKMVMNTTVNGTAAVMQFCRDLTVMPATIEEDEII